MSQDAANKKKKNFVERSRVRKNTRAILFATVLLALLMLQSMPSVAHAQNSSLTMQAWVRIMNRTPTPGTGCWVAMYPDTVWHPTPCTSHKSGAMTVGNGVDNSADSINYNMADSTGSFTSESGMTSESDSKYGTNYYTLQVNSQTFSTTYYGRSTTGWEQFAFQNGGNGYVFIQYWMLGYASKYGSCPSGWTQHSSDCYINSASVSTGLEYPNYLNKYTLTGSVSSTTDTSKFCDSNKGKCYSTTGSDGLNLNNNWWDTEFNVFGYCCASQANFNSGTKLGVEIDNFEPGQSCSTAGYTGETDNLNLNNNCAGGSQQQYITFSESN